MNYFSWYFFLENIDNLNQPKKIKWEYIKNNIRNKDILFVCFKIAIKNSFRFIH